MRKKNVEEVVKQGLCLGCGICQDFCRTSSISICHKKNAVYPVVDYQKCNECGVCLKICAGKGIDILAMASEHFSDDSSYDKYVGYYHSCFSCYSTDFSIRYHSASGGSVSQFLIYLLEKRIIDGAVVVGYQDNNPFLPISYIAKSKDDVLAAKSSKYCIVSFEGIIKTILENDGRYVVVGLPCHIHAFRKSIGVSLRLKKRIVGLFSIYCSSNRTLSSIDYFLYRYNISKEDIKSFSFRDEGYLGSMVFKNRHGEIIKSIHYQDYWKGMKGFFNVPRCSLCIDHFGELADVSFGDLYVGKYKKEKIGVNSIITRNSFWHHMLLKAKDSGYLFLEPIDVETIKESQPYALKQKKGRGVAGAIRLRKILHKSIPFYGSVVIDKAGLIDVLKECGKMIMRAIGRCRRLWIVVRKMDS